MVIKMREKEHTGELTQQEHVHHPVHFDSKLRKEASDFVNDPGLLEYLENYGYHFNNALAEYASRMMENYNGQQHTWTTSQVKKTMESLGLTIPSKVTIGDLTYAANMAYADYYPDPLKDETSCIKYAYMTANDKDGYEGMIFNRWLSDLMGKHTKLDWKKFI